MKNHMIKAGTCTPALKVGDVSFNVSHIIQMMLAHKDCGLLVFPELSICGYTCADLFDNQALLHGCEEGLKEIVKTSKECPGQTNVIGVPVMYHNNLYNCAAYVNEGRIAGIVPKINIPSYSEFYEMRWFASGKDIQDTFIDYAGQHIPFGTDILFKDQESTAVIGTDICEDLWVADKPGTHACLAGANIIVNLSASDEIIGKEDYRRSLVINQSASCYCDYLYASSGTGESSTDLVFSGHNLIAENGRLLKESIFEDNDHCITAILDLDTIQYNRIHQNTYENVHTDTYRFIPVHVSSLAHKSDITVDELADALNKEDYFIAKNPFVPSDDSERASRCHKILRIQAHGLATRVRSTGIHNLVIGISGGLDSTLALLVCHEAQKIEPSIHIIAYTLPNHGNTTSLTYNNAIALMKELHAEAREIAIDEPVKRHLKELGHSESYEGDGDTAYENAQARYRTYILMDAANMENGLVVGTGDLSELALGWCTYNGDHMSMYGVNASVPKTLVQYICRTYAETTDNHKLRDILISICDTPITPELTPNQNGEIAQKTEDKIGKYDLNDFFLYYTLRYGMRPDKMMAFAMHAYPELDKEEVRSALLRFFNRFFHQQFKRSCLPDGPKVGSVTLSPRGDWRMPSDASVSLWTEIIKNA